MAKSASHIERFYGDIDRVGENPHDFVKQIQVYFLDNTTATDEDKTTLFGLLCRAGHEGEVWFDAQDAATKRNWAQFMAAFLAKWPKRSVMTKTSEESQQELREEVLEESEMLEMVERNGVKTYRYKAWADRLDLLSAAIPDPAGLLIREVRDAGKMPTALRETVGLSHKTWSGFTTAIRAVEPHTLREAIAKERRLQNLEKQSQYTPPTPSTALATSFQRARITSPPQSPSPKRTMERVNPHLTPTPSQTALPDIFSSGGAPRTRLFAFPPTPVPTTPNHTRTTALPATTYRDPKARLLDLQHHSIPHHPDTVQGHAAYQRQIQAYHAANGNTKADEFHPYPLTPGTEALSSGACFNCGRNSPAKHPSFQCPHDRDASRSLPPLERAWRAVAAIIHGIIRPRVPAAQQPTPIRAVDIVNAGAVDVTDLDEASISDLLAGGATITEIEEGKVQGPSS